MAIVFILISSGIFDRQSAATLQKSIVAFSMPKANRFSQEPKYSGEPSYCVDSCFRKNTTKGAGFGFGRKKQFPDWMERNMKENPAPGSYIDLDDVRGKGPTFGLGHKYYERVMIPREKKPVHTTNRSKLLVTKNFHRSEIRLTNDHVMSSLIFFIYHQNHT